MHVWSEFFQKYFVAISSQHWLFFPYFLSSLFFVVVRFISFVVFHFGPITRVIILHSFPIAFVLMHFPCLAIQAIRWESFMWLRIMFHQIVNISCLKFHFAWETKIWNFFIVEVSTKSRWYCINFGTLIIHCSITVAIPNMMLIITHDFDLLNEVKIRNVNKQSWIIAKTSSITFESVLLSINSNTFCNAYHHWDMQHVLITG